MWGTQRAVGRARRGRQESANFVAAAKRTDMSFLTVMVALVGIFASILNAQFGAGTFLFAAVALRWLKHPEAVRQTLLPFYVGGKVVLYAVKLSVT